MTTSNKKIVFLFGAGAVLDWGAPKTLCSRNELEIIPEHGSGEIVNRVCCLTHLITAIGFYGNDGTRLTDKILRLLNARTPESKANFETIINLIEDLYSYRAAQKGKMPGSIFSILNLDNQGQDLSFFEYLLHDKTKTYSISIPKFPHLDQSFPLSEEGPFQKYYELLLTELLGGIKGHISKYSWYTKGSNEVIFNEANRDVNDNFVRWMRNFASMDYCLRMYTLNYDRIFKVLLQNNDIDVFEGFDVNGTAVDYGDAIPPNLTRIITDFSSNIHYNLHGSAFWNIENLNDSNLPGYQYLLVPFGQINSPTTTIQIEKGRQLLLTNIITGYQKVQKTSISPFRQMFSAFDRDCYEAEKLYIIGYSLGDEHINDMIRNARKSNSKLEIIIVNPSFDDKQFALDFMLHWGRPQQARIYEKVGDYETISKDYNLKVTTKTFGEFLKDIKTEPK